MPFLGGMGWWGRGRGVRHRLIVQVKQAFNTNYGNKKVRYTKYGNMKIWKYDIQNTKYGNMKVRYTRYTLGGGAGPELRDIG